MARSQVLRRLAQWFGVLRLLTCTSAVGPLAPEPRATPSLTASVNPAESVARFLHPRTAGLAVLQDGGGQSWGMRLLLFLQRFGDSPWSTGLHESRYAYDLIESVHVWTLCLFFGLTVLFNLRLLGWAMGSVPVSDVARRFLPWTIAGFVVISGLLLFSAIPSRSYQSLFFRAKMRMLLLAGLNVWIFHSGLYRRVSSWDLDRVPPRSARVAGALSIVLWIRIVISGRMIAYNWFDCDRQPQPAIVSFLTTYVPNGPG